MSNALRFSLGANVALVGLVAVMLWRGRLEIAPSAVKTETSSIPTAARTVVADPAPAVAATIPGAGKIDPAAFAQLEKLGLPRHVVVNAILEDFHHRWDRQFSALERKFAPRRVPERAYIELGRVRDAEKTRELKEALGEEGYRAWDKERILRLHNNTNIALSDAEAEQVYLLQTEFDAQHRELDMAMEDGAADKADASALQGKAQEALDRSLEQLLGKSRFAALRGISDPAADVQRQFGDLNPTPVQTQAVLKADEEFRAREEELTRRLNASPAEGAIIAAELKRLNDGREERLAGIFGAEAYATAKRANDPTYQTLQLYAQAWQLQGNEVESVYAAISAYRDEAERTRIVAQMNEAAGQPVNWREVNAAIEAVRLQTEAGLLTAIGGERLDRLKQNGLLTITRR